MLPVGLPHTLKPPEGDLHRKAKQGALSALDDFFRRAGRRIYLSSELIVFYPGEPRFVPDLIAVLDVDPHDRTRWVVDAEGKGIDFVLEVLVAGDQRKDLELNVERYARLGIHEYFVFDRARLRLHGYRLAPAPGPERARATATAYQRVVPQAGHFPSAVLGLDLVLDGERLRFFAGNAPLEDADEMIARLGTMLDKVIAREEELTARLEEERRLREEERRLREEVDRQLAEARSELARLKSK
ncbi:hypothetical protein BH11MYX4_BH11MYX4_60320 [soil metagenome]